MDRVKYDVAVVGAGIGGLAAAAYCSSHGLKVLVIEKLMRIGGRCSSYEYKGFCLPTGAIGPEVGGSLESLFRDLGLSFEVRPLNKILFNVGGKIIQPRANRMQTLLEATGAQAPEVEAVLAAYRRALSWALPSKAITFHAWLSQYTSNAAVHALFNTIIQSVLIVNTSEVSAHDYFLYLKTSGGVGAGYPAVSSLSFIEPLAKLVKERGGDVWTGARAERILVEDASVKGVKVMHGEREAMVEAGVVVSNCSPYRTITLAGEQHFEPGYLGEVRNQRPAPMFWLYLQSDRPLFDGDAMMVADAHRLIALFQPTRLSPDMAPPGKHLVLAHGTFSSSLPPFKQSLELAQNISDLKELLPGFKPENNLLRTGVFRGEWPGAHAWPGMDSPQKTPVQNLYVVGDGARPPGMQGLPSCAASGRLAAEDIVRRLKSRSPKGG